MDREETPGNVVPPYVPYRTLRTFVDGFRQGIPQRIDRSIMQSMGGTIQRQLTYALQYLQLVDKNGIPQEILPRWVRAEGQDRQQILRSILQTAYPFLLGDRADSFDLATATSRQLAEKFQQYDIHGETVRRAEAFFLHAASDAGLTVSPYIKKPSKQQGEPHRSTRSRNIRQPNRRNGTTDPLFAQQNVERSVDEGRSTDVSTTRGQLAFGLDDPSPALSALGEGFFLLGGLLRQLPANRRWTQERREQWLKALTAMLDFLIEVAEPSKEAPQEGGISGK